MYVLHTEDTNTVKENIEIQSQKTINIILEEDTNSTDLQESSLRLLLVQSRSAKFPAASNSMADETSLPTGYHYGWYTLEQLNVYYNCMIGNYQDGGDDDDDTDSDGVDTEVFGDGEDNEYVGNKDIKSASSHIFQYLWILFEHGYLKSLLTTKLISLITLEYGENIQ